MSQQPYDLQLFWDKTDNGLIFFQDEFASEIANNRGKLKGFKVRDNDDTGSCHISKSKASGKWVFTDFGDSNKGINAIDYVIEKNGKTFLEACHYLFAKYGLPVSQLQANEPKTEFTSKVTKPEGFWKVDFYKKIEATSYLKNIIPFYTDELLQRFNFQQVKSYENVGMSAKSDKLYHRIITANDHFPIFGYNEKDFCKLYQPEAQKGHATIHKHSFVGTKPTRQIYGWDKLFAKVDIDKIDYLVNKLKTPTGRTIEIGDDWTIIDESEKSNKDVLQELKEIKLDKVIIATGGTDGMNIASLGYDVIWFNSESEIINKNEYWLLKKICNQIYYCPDLDTTGVKQAVAMGMKFLNIKMIWLPETLKLKRKKDVADWVREHKSLPLAQVKSLFEQLLTQALPFQFWEWNDGKCSLNNKIMLYFLKYNGFYLNKVVLKSADSVSEIEKTRIVHIKNNVVKPVSPRQVKNYVLQWLDDNFVSIRVYNMILKSVYFSENALLSLPEIAIDTKTGDYNSQLYFFKNKVARITAEKIEAIDYASVPNLVWQNDIIDHHFELQKPFFEITKTNGAWDIELFRNDSNYLKVLINTSRMFWEKDADATGKDLNIFNITSTKLTDEENAIQKLQLINKIYVVGYLLHKYKIKQNAFFTLGVDNKNGISTKESNGRSGKSFIQECLKCFLKNWKDKNGKLLPKENPQFIYDKVTANTDYILFDDLTEYQDYNFFFAVTTGSLEANHKGGEIHDIPFEDSPKLGGTTNFAPRNLSSSLQGRLLAYYVSDYYHQKTTDNGYAFTRQISDDFGNKTILDKHYPAEQWQNDYNLMLQCLQFYLSVNEKIDAPIEGLLIKNLRQSIGDPLLKFFNEYFKEDNTLNCWVHKKDVFDLYREDIGSKAKSPQAFKENLIDYCTVMDWGIEFKKMKPENNPNKSVEHFYINVSKSKIIHQPVAENQPELELETAGEEPPSDDLPF